MENVYKINFNFKLVENKNIFFWLEFLKKKKRVNEILKVVNKDMV